MPALTSAAHPATMRQSRLPYAKPTVDDALTSKNGDRESLVLPMEGSERLDLSDIDHIPYPTSPSVRANYRTAAGKKVSEFQWRVYDLVRRIELGKITTYGILAALLADDGKGSARAVGSALRNNPFAPFVPCHRIVNADLYISGFSGDYGLQPSMAPTTVDAASLKGTAQRKGTKGTGSLVWKKVGMLAQEGVAVDSKGFVIGGRASYGEVEPAVTSPPT